MILLGLTGGVGMGKSAGAQLLGGFKLPVIDTDLLARELVEPGQPALAEISACFGDQVLSPDAQLNREALAKRVFSDPAARQRLEAILHPRIRERWLAETKRWASRGERAGVVAIPLLFETAATLQFNATLCVACSAATQRLRLRARGWSEEEVDRRIQAQWPVEKKMLLADFVIWSEGSLALHESQLKRVLAELRIPPVEPEPSSASV